jgi:DNA polymerase-1
MILSTGIKTHRRGLDACVKRYKNIELSKEERGLINTLGIYDDRIIKYAADDVLYLNDIREEQLKLLKEKDLLNTLQIDNDFVYVLAYIEYCGIGFDSQKWYNLAVSNEHKRDELGIRLNKIVEEIGNIAFLEQPNLFEPNWTCNINWNSQDQIIPLFKSLGVDTVIIDKKTGEYKDSIESKYLKKQKGIHEIIPLYLEYQELQKKCSTYGKSFLKHVNKITNRIHTDYKQIINTGRMSSGGEDNEGSTDKHPNLQNIPAGQERTCFIPGIDNVLVIADYSSQESRILAEFSKDSKLVEFYLSGEADLHSYATKLVFAKDYPEMRNMSLDEIKKNFKNLRQLMKGFNFALA